MGEQMKYRDRFVGRSELRTLRAGPDDDLGIAKLRKIFFYRIKQTQFPFLKKDQCRHAHHNLCHRIDADDRVALHWDPKRTILKPGGENVSDLASGYDQPADPRVF